MYTDNRRKLFVTSSGGDKISVSNANDSGNATPIRSIASNTGLFRSQGIFVDVENNEIFVASSGNNTITVYEISFKRRAFPLRKLGGSNTGLLYPFGVFVTASQ